MIVNKTISSLILMMLIFLTNATVLADTTINQNSLNINEKYLLKEGWDLYYSSNDKQAEDMAKRLLVNDDKDGTATMLLAAIYYRQKHYKKTLYLLFNHAYLKILYAKSISEKNNNKWSDDKVTLYYHLKSLSGRARYQLGERSESVLKDLIAGVSYADNDPLIATPNAEAFQFAGLLSFALENYEQAAHYWKRLLKYFELKWERKLRIREKVKENDYVVFHATEYNIACAYAKLGNIDKTLIWLNKSIVYKLDKRIKSIMTDSDLDNVRNHKKFKDFIKQNQLKLEGQVRKSRGQPGMALT